MRAQPKEIAAVLGLPGTTTLLQLAERCEEGLPVDSLQMLAQALSIDEKAFSEKLFSRSTLRRRQRRGNLTAAESDLLVRLAGIWVMAADTFGDKEKARQFLYRDHSLINGRRPFDIAVVNAPGAEAVEQLLGRLRYGTAA